jgi:riboflavin synthase
MFTGIIESMGRVAAIEPRGELTRLVLEAPDSIIEGIGVGDSIAVSGTCLTVVAVEGDRISFDCVQETLDRTSLGDQEVGSRLNLELALRAGGRLDGHIVQGHVDGTGTVRAFEREGDDVRLYVDCGPEVSDFLVDKGSVAIDGVSLTVVGASDTGFDVALIPYTLEVTTLGERKPGDRVNLEADVLGKYVKHYLDRLLPGLRAAL